MSALASSLSLATYRARAQAALWLHAGLMSCALGVALASLGHLLWA
jgi:hypothetical protein